MAFWYLHSRLVTASFLQSDGKVRIYQSNNILRGGIRSIVHAHTAHTGCKTEKYFDGTTDHALSMPY